MARATLRKLGYRVLRFLGYSVGPIIKSFLLPLLPFLVVSGCASSRGNQAACGDHGDLLSATTHVVTTVPLKPRPSDSSLYLISDHYLILMRPNDVVTLLEARVAQQIHAREDELLLAAIKAKLPITDDTDCSSSTAEDELVDARHVPHVRACENRSLVGLLDRAPHYPVG